MFPHVGVLCLRAASGSRCRLGDDLPRGYAAIREALQAQAAEEAAVLRQIKGQWEELVADHKRR